jgi:hypothetical protein
MNTSDRTLFIAAFILAIWLSAVVRALRNKELNDTTRFMWVFIITMMPIFGGLLYLFFGRFVAKPVSISEVAESEARHRMSGIYEKTEWQNR